MSVAVALLLAACFALVMRKPLARFPSLFYLLAVALDIVLVFGKSAGISVALWRGVLTFQARCLPAFGLFAVVMFIGVFKEGSAAKRLLAPIRGELSVIASILALGHAVNYVGVFWDRFSQPALADMLPFQVVSSVLVALLLLLAVTSLKAVKRRMSVGTWKRIQRLSYVFWGAVLVHVALILGPSALAGTSSAFQNLAVYAVVFAAYAVMRVRRHVIDKKSEPAEKGLSSKSAVDFAG